MLPLLILVLESDLLGLPALLCLACFGVFLRSRIFYEILLLTSSSAFVGFESLSGERERPGLGDAELLFGELGETERLPGELEFLLGDEDALLFGALEEAEFAERLLCYFFFVSTV